MNNKTTTQSVTEIGEQQTGSYLQLFLYRAPEKNNEAIAKNLRQFMPWFKEHGARVKYYQLGKRETETAIDSAKENGMYLLDNIAKILSTTAEDDEEEVWLEAQYFREYEHCKDVYAKMMQEKSLEPLGNEFSDLITQGKKLITGGFIPLRE
jgi:uncharacterized protein YbaA (DUF1428 family)